MNLSDEFDHSYSAVQVEEFPKYFKNAADTQKGLDKLKRKIALVLSRSLRHYALSSQSAEQVEEDRALAKRLRERLDNFEKSLFRIKDAGNRRKILGLIAVESKKLERIEGRLSRYEPADLLLGKTDRNSDQVFAAKLKNTALQLGEWFATGAVGPGTVTFEGKRFTAG